MLGDFGDGAFEDPRDTCGETRNAHGVVRAGFEFVWHEVGLNFKILTRSRCRPGGWGGVFFQAGADVERAGALGAQQAFVAGEGHEVDEIGLDINGDVAGGLGGIDHEDDATFSRDLADGADVLQGAGDVGGVGHGDHFGVGADGGGGCLRDRRDR